MFLNIKLKKIGFLRTCLLICCVIHATITWAQNPICKRFFDENNAVTGAIYDVFQDKTGFIWLGTENGLARFDGKKIVYFPAPKNYDKSVTNLFEDKYGTIYCQNFSGHYFKKLNAIDSLKIILAISKFGNIKQGNIIDDTLIGCFSKQGIQFYNFQKNAVQSKVSLPPELQPSTIKGKSDNYAVIDPNRKTLAFYYPNGKNIVKQFNSTNVVFYHILFKNHHLIFGKRPPFVIEDIETGQCYPLKEINSSTIINHLSVIDSEHFIILTSNGVYIYNKAFKLVRHIFSKESISSVLVDQQNNWWFGTLNKGLILVSQPQTLTYLNDIGFKSITFKKSTCIVGSRSNEIFEIDVNKNQTYLVYKDSAIHDVRKLHYNDIKDEIVFSNQYLNFLKNGKLTRVINSVNDIYQVNNDLYILAEGSNLSLYPISDKDSLFRKFKQNDIGWFANRLSLFNVNTRVKSALLLGNDKIVAITSRGLICFYGQLQKELLYKNERIKAVSLAKINNDSLLIATPNNGILLFTKGKVNEFISSDKFHNSETFMMKIFEHKVFVVTYKGLHVFDFNKNKLTEQFLSDGYHGIDLVDFVFRNDTTYLVSTTGVIASPLKIFIQNNVPPSICLTNAKVNGKEFNNAQLKNFNYNSYFFEFNFCVIDYRGLETTKAFYRVNDGDWIEASDNKILLTALEPNTYRIQIKAISDRGLESLKPVLISFTIKPPFYRTIWFIILVFVVLLIIALLLFRTRLKTISKQSLLLTQKIELEKALRNSTLSGIKAQMNPHFIFNALNTIQSYIYLNDKKTAGDYLVSFSELMRSILEMSTKDYIQLNEELKALHLYLRLEKMRFEDDFNYTIKVADNVEESLRIPSMLIQPYVENAIKHGLLHKKGIKNLEIQFYKRDSNLIVEIIDNGIGIEASMKLNLARNKKHNSFATQANQLRLELLNANSKGNIGVESFSLKNETEQVIGTKIIIKIPFNL